MSSLVPQLSQGAWQCLGQTGRPTGGPWWPMGTGHGHWSGVRKVPQMSHMSICGLCLFLELVDYYFVHYQSGLGLDSLWNFSGESTRHCGSTQTMGGNRFLIIPTGCSDIWPHTWALAQLIRKTQNKKRQGQRSGGLSRTLCVCVYQCVCIDYGIKSTQLWCVNPAQIYWGIQLLLYVNILG